MQGRAYLARVQYALELSADVNALRCVAMYSAENPPLVRSMPNIRLRW